MTLMILSVICSFQIFPRSKTSKIIIVEANFSSKISVKTCLVHNISALTGKNVEMRMPLAFCMASFIAFNAKLN